MIKIERENCDQWYTLMKEIDKNDSMIEAKEDSKKINTY
jgi:hypothetical protein